MAPESSLFRLLQLMLTKPVNRLTFGVSIPPELRTAILWRIAYHSLNWNCCTRYTRRRVRLARGLLPVNCHSRVSSQTWWSLAELLSAQLVPGRNLAPSSFALRRNAWNRTFYPIGPVVRWLIRVKAQETKVLSVSSRDHSEATSLRFRVQILIGWLIVLNWINYLLEKFGVSPHSGEKIEG